MNIIIRVIHDSHIGSVNDHKQDSKKRFKIEGKQRKKVKTRFEKDLIYYQIMVEENS